MEVWDYMNDPSNAGSSDWGSPADMLEEFLRRQFSGE